MTSTRSCLPGQPPALAVLVLACSAFASVALADPVAVSGAPDITLDQGGTVLRPGDVSTDIEAQAPGKIDLGPLPDGAEVTAFSSFSEAAYLFALGHTMTLQGGVTASPRDIVEWDGAAYSLALEGASIGLPVGVGFDAIEFDPYTADVWLSFDTTVDFGGEVVRDADVVDVSTLARVFDATAAGVPFGMDVDAVSRVPGTSDVLLSFDVGGSLGGVTFADEDVLRYDATNDAWVVEIDASASQPSWGPADLQAMQIVPEPGMASGFVGGLLGLVVMARLRRERRQTAALRLLAMALVVYGGALVDARAASASDGAIELNQACAVVTGCLSGDSPGFPITLGAGSGQAFRLTSDLIVPSSPVRRGIYIPTGRADITIDLNGFSVIEGSCVGATTACTPATYTVTNNGIEQAGSSELGVTLFDGQVIGFAGSGVVLGENAMVRNVEARWNAGFGIGVKKGSIVVDSRSQENGLSGFSDCCESPGGSGTIVARSTARGNASQGIRADGSALVIDSTAESNGGNGIETGLASVIVGNSAVGNTGDGFSPAYTSLLMRNASSGNHGDGFEAGFGGGTSFISNVARNNDGVGISMDDYTGFRENISDNNALGDTVSGIDLGANACGGTAGCP